MNSASWSMGGPIFHTIVSSVPEHAVTSSGPTTLCRRQCLPNSVPELISGLIASRFVPRMSPELLQHYADQFRSLHTDVEAGRSRPHKAVMLLSVITLAESGRLPENRIYYSSDLLQIFSRFFDAVRAGSDRRTPFNPFFYLKSDRFWHLHPQPGQEALLATTPVIRGPGQLTGLVSYASFDDALFGLLTERTSREVLRLTLIDRYFPARRDDVLSICSEEAQIAQAERRLEEGVAQPEQIATAVRDAAFSRTVCKAYDYTCAMCGVRFVCEDVIMVDAAHLVPFSESHNDSPTNGIALCKNHHWLMDKFLISPAPGRGRDYAHPVWLVSPYLDSRLEAHRFCIAFRDQSVILPREERYRPAQDALDWRATHLRR
jgi:putative restriction endonuclease